MSPDHARVVLRIASLYSTPVRIAERGQSNINICPKEVELLQGYIDFFVFTHVLLLLPTRGKSQKAGINPTPPLREYRTFTRYGFNKSMLFMM